MKNKQKKGFANMPCGRLGGTGPHFDDYRGGRGGGRPSYFGTEQGNKTRRSASDSVRPPKETPRIESELAQGTLAVRRWAPTGIRMRGCILDRQPWEGNCKYPSRAEPRAEPNRGGLGGDASDRADRHSGRRSSCYHISRQFSTPILS